MHGTELQPLSLARYPLVLLPVGLLGALTAMAATRVARGRPTLGALALGLGAFALASVSVYLGRNGAPGSAASVPSPRPNARDLFAGTPRREARAAVDGTDRSMRRPDRFPTISPPPKPGATRPS